MRNPTAALVVVLTLAVAPAAMAGDCPPVDPHRTPLQTFAARNAALAVGDVALAMCAYDEDAIVVMPGTVVRGRAAVTQAFLGFGALFGGAQPTVTSTTEADDVLLLTYTLTGPTLSITDGADTFVVRNGRFVRQTVHATLSPTKP